MKTTFLIDHSESMDGRWYVSADGKLIVCVCFQQVL